MIPGGGAGDVKVKCTALGCAGNRGKRDNKQVLSAERLNCALHHHTIMCHIGGGPTSQWQWQWRHIHDSTRLSGLHNVQPKLTFSDRFILWKQEKNSTQKTTVPRFITREKKNSTIIPEMYDYTYPYRLCATVQTSIDNLDWISGQQMELLPACRKDSGQGHGAWLHK